MKLKNIIYNIIGVAVIALTFAACENIDESDRLIYVEPVAASRCVLVEEYSGQDCVNCPEGAAELERIMNEYGHDSVIVVSIQGGMAIHEGEYEGILGLATDFTEQLYANAGKPSQPSAIIDRRGGVKMKSDWMGEIKNALLRPSTVTLNIDKQYDATTRKLDVTIKAQSNLDYKGNLNVWLTEDNIVAVQQFVSDYDFNYVHNHILRTALTEDKINGYPIALNWDDEQPNEYQFSVVLRDDYKAENMTIVAFVDNADGVAQTTKTSVIEK